MVVCVEKETILTPSRGLSAMILLGKKVLSLLIFSHKLEKVTAPRKLSPVLFSCYKNSCVIYNDTMQKVRLFMRCFLRKNTYQVRDKIFRPSFILTATRLLRGNIVLLYNISRLPFKSLSAKRTKE